MEGNVWKGVIGIVVLFILSFTSQSVNAQSYVDEEIKLSKLTVSAFECSIVAPDQTESYRRILVTDWVRRQRFELAI
jgi:hypothetical protein